MSHAVRQRYYFVNIPRLPGQQEQAAAPSASAGSPSKARRNLGSGLSRLRESTGEGQGDSRVSALDSQRSGEDRARRNDSFATSLAGGATETRSMPIDAKLFLVVTQRNTG